MARPATDLASASTFRDLHTAASDHSNPYLATTNDLQLTVATLATTHSQLTPPAFPTADLPMGATSITRSLMVKISHITAVLPPTITPTTAMRARSPPMAASMLQSSSSRRSKSKTSHSLNGLTTIFGDFNSSKNFW